MNRTIPYYIRRMLIERRSVYIPNIGVLSLEHRPAVISDHRQTISPPSSHVSYKEKHNDSSELVEWVADAEKISRGDAQSLLNNYTQDLFNQLVNFRSTEIEGLGTLTKSGDNLSFDASYVPAEQEGKLSTIRLQPIKRLKQAPSASAVVAQKKKSFDWMPILLGFLIGLVMVGLFSIGRYIMSDAPQHTRTEVIPLDYKEATAESAMPDVNTNNYGQSIPTSGRCLIITGSFSKQKHVDEMVDLLEADGYQTYVESFYDLTRVGINFSCNEVELEGFLQEVRSKYSAFAWYLDPEIEVAYAE